THPAAPGDGDRPHPPPTPLPRPLVVPVATVVDGPARRRGSLTHWGTPLGFPKPLRLIGAPPHRARGWGAVSPARPVATRLRRPGGAGTSPRGWVPSAPCAAAASRVRRPRRG